MVLAKERLMPYSSDAGKAIIERFIRRKQRWNGKYANLVLDIGAGSGTYFKKFGKLIKPSTWTGIEIWEPYVEQFKLTRMYEELLIKDAIEGVNELLQRDARFDYIFIGDILEHLPREKAVNLTRLAASLLQPDGLMFYSVPIGEYPQDAYLGNPHEAHVDTYASLAELKHTLAEVRYVEQQSEIGIAVATRSEGFYNELMAPRVAVYMICKNEETFIGRAVESARAADEIIVCDTGSTDRTVDELQAMGLPQLQVHEIFVSPWRFDDARNTALSIVSAEVDWCISLDADEFLDLNFIQDLKRFIIRLRIENKYPTRINHSFETYWNWNKPNEEPSKAIHFHERIHVRHNYKWIHPVHEKLVFHGAERIEWNTSLRMIQHPDTTKSRSSYKELLELAVKEDPKDWKLWTFLAGELAGTNVIGAIEAYETATHQPGADLSYCYLRIGELYERSGSQAEAKRAFKDAVSANPNVREMHIALGEYLERQQSYQGALSAYEDALAITNPTAGYLRRENAWNGGLEASINRVKHAVAMTAAQASSKS